MGMFSKIKNKVDKVTGGGPPGMPTPPGMPGGGSPFDKNRVEQRIDYLKKNRPNDPALQHLQNAVQTGSEKSLQMAKDVGKKGWNQAQNMSGMNPPNFNQDPRNLADQFRSPQSMGPQGGWGSMGNQINQGMDRIENISGDRPHTYLPNYGHRQLQNPVGKPGGWGSPRDPQTGRINDPGFERPPTQFNYAPQPQMPPGGWGSAGPNGQFAGPGGQAQQFAGQAGFQVDPGRMPGQGAPIQGVPGRIPPAYRPQQPMTGGGARPATPVGPMNVFKGQLTGAPNRGPQKRVVGLLSRPPE
jgi:hypothetical protein